jgi:hypothetical protein
MAPAKLDDLRLDLLARFLPLAHPASVTQNEITALESSRPAWHPDLRAPLSNHVSNERTPR